MTGTGKRLGMGVNAVASLLLAGMLLVMVNYISHKYYARFDVARTQRQGLSDATAQLLRGLDGDVDMLLLASPEHDLYGDVVRLLRECALFSDRIRVEIVHPGRDLARTRELALKHGISEPNCVILDSAGRFKVLMLDDMAEYGSRQANAGFPRKLVAFRGEQILSSSIKSLIEEGSPVVYFLAGHGEGRIDDYDQHFGYSMIARFLHGENIEVRSLLLGGEKSVPSDCDALVIAGPTRPLIPREVDIIKSYLNASGRMLLMVEAGIVTGLENLLLDWGVRLSFDRVVGATLTGGELVVADYGDHVVTKALKNVRTIFNRPRSVEPTLAPEAFDAGSVDRPSVTVLATCAADGWAEMTQGQSPPLFDPGIDRPGPIPVAVAIERGGIKSFEVELSPTRIVVIGDASMIANGALLAGYDTGLFLGALNWLLDRDVPLDMAAPERSGQLPIVMTLDQRRAVFWVVAVMMPAAACLLGIIVWAARRR